MNVHELAGCAPAPLAYYLKALGILRLVSEQVDPRARGWWAGERFLLATRLDRAGLEEFLLEKYRPTAILSPWNKGSGFFLPNDPGMAPLESSSAERFHPFRAGIVAGRALLQELEDADRAVRAIKGETKDKRLSRKDRDAIRNSPEYKRRLAEAERKFKALKAELLPRIRRAWRGTHREWMDAAMVIGDDGSPKFPALLGTGGNDGRLDFTNNFMLRLNAVFDLPSPEGSPRLHATAWTRGSLWGCAVPGCQSGSAVGQYLPGLAGGANNANGPNADSLLNPMDFILMMEGAVLFTAHCTRRLVSSDRARAAAPFALSAQGAGYASAADSDESARGEQWMPLWSLPSSLAELKRLLAEGRAQIGARSASEPLDLARAVGRLGIARGIATFQRFGYIERNGQSNLAVPLGRFRVPERVSPALACLDDLDAWLPGLRRQARAKQAPARLRDVEHRLADALFAVAQHPAEPARWQLVLLSLAEVEGVLVTGTGFKAGPVPKLRPEWVRAADDGTAEFRLALACALQARGFGREDGRPIDPVRRHWLPLKGRRFATTGTGGQTRLEPDPAVVLHGRSGLQDAVALVERRLIEAGQRGQRQLPLVAARGACALAGDLASLIAGEVELDRTMALARALMALDGKAWAANPLPTAHPARGGVPDDAWLVVRLALLPWSLPDGRRIGSDPAILRRLAGGDAAAAVELALRRLSAAGIATPVRAATAPPATAARWAAALAFPITRNLAVRFLHRLDPRQEVLS